jgi:hypothetical protein
MTAVYKTSMCSKSVVVCKGINQSGLYILD